jgi:signal transduction histidine kinase
LGLAIVKACVEGHGGDVRISSSPGVTRVVVDLPADAEHADIMPKPVRSVAGSA